jgi:uncharacterized protein YukE
MKKISQSDLKRIEEARAKIAEKKTEIESVVQEIQSKIDALVAEAEEARQELHGVLDDLVSTAESYYDERSDNWREGDAGSAYEEWKSQIENARDTADVALDYQIDENPSFDEWDTVIGAVEEGTIPESPEAC